MNQPKSYAESAEPAQPLLRGFWSLIVTQFEGAFNDNALQTLVTFVGMSMVVSVAKQEALLSLTAALFALPFILLSMAGAEFFARFSGRQVWSGAILVALALIGLAFSLGITRVPAADPARRFHANFLSELAARLSAENNTGEKGDA
jgi:hypothetical protein